ncbi:olfactory receptor 10J5-like [Pempheris klunzingeri]|uniref:olfactory receptor 10J5-like n=1 Tax=Pempheris klunzingeri TaxID=3127111 RepID=UPI0039801621
MITLEAKPRMMRNSTQVSHFTLAAYSDTGMFKYLLFLMILFYYLVIVGANVLLVVVICVNRSLHEPMYLFLCSLFVNELYGSTGLFPFLLLQILSDTHTVPAPCCFLQVFSVYSYVCIEFSNLAVMSYDRYLAICCPLQYNTRMTIGKVFVLVAVTWLYSFLTIVILISLIAPLQLCGDVIDKVYCVNYSIVKLACSDTTVNNIYGLIVTFLTVFGPLVLILFTYMRILKVCLSGSKQTRQKAVSTCTPHLASLLNFCFGVCFEILQSRFDMKSVHSVLQIVLSLYFLTCQPLFNAVMYGLNISKIRSMCKSLLFHSAPSYMAWSAGGGSIIAVDRLIKKASSVLGLPPDPVEVVGELSSVGWNPTWCCQNCW